MRSMPLALSALSAGVLALAAGPALAGTGQQSPIDIPTADVPVDASLPALEIDYPEATTVTVEYIRKDADDPEGCTTRDPEETIEAHVPHGAASVTVGGKEFELQQLHFHTPSEHLVDGDATPVEQHLVHQAADGELLVLGVRIEQGAPSEVDTVLADPPAECGPDSERAGVDLRALLPEDLSSYRYTGSLTTSPFTGGVNWAVFAETVTASPGAIGDLDAVFPEHNARDVQPLTGPIALRPQS
ncbi:carbonic anhydrase family protein [Marinactinospora rubrisoli]|uniref:carbonic anhydrase n=1 Tax=Marinactinospora rubrisoli TaxID=2715399 RepID=A0ABW2KPX0_9ACTN